VSNIIETITIIPDIGKVVNQGQKFIAKIKIKNINSWTVSECMLTVTNTENCNIYMVGIKSFNLNNISAGETSIIEIPFIATDSLVGIASITVSFDSVIDGTHYCSGSIGGKCWNMVNPNPLVYSNSKVKKLEIFAE